MKIAIDARESGTSTGRYVDKLIEYLAQTNSEHKFTVVTRPSRTEFMHKIAPRFAVEETRIKEFTFAEQLALPRQIKKLNPDLMHFTIVQQPVLYRGRVVTTFHDLTTTRFGNPSKSWFVFKFKQFVYKWVNVIVAHKSQALLANSEYTKQDVAKFTRINSRKITVTYEAADKIVEPAEPLEALQDKQFIMYIGRPNPHKNLDRLIEAFNIVKQVHPGLQLVLAGKKDTLYEQIANRFKRGEKFDDVLQTGFISDAQLRWLYENTAAYAFPSLSEGFGLPGLEAMAHGAPVASSNATCLPEIYGDAAHYFDPLDVEDIAHKLDDILTKPALRDKLIAKGHEQVKKYSWKRMAEQTLAVYNEVLEK